MLSTTTNRPVWAQKVMMNASTARHFPISYRPVEPPPRFVNTQEAATRSSENLSAGVAPFEKFNVEVTGGTSGICLTQNANYTESQTQPVECGATNESKQRFCDQFSSTKEISSRLEETIVRMQCESVRKQVIDELRNQTKSILNVLNGCMVDMIECINKALMTSNVRLAVDQQQTKVSNSMDKKCQRIAKRLKKKIKDKLLQSIKQHTLSGPPHQLDFMLNQILKKRTLSKRRSIRRFRRQFSSQKKITTSSTLSFAIIRDRLK